MTIDATTAWLLPRLPTLEPEDIEMAPQTQRNVMRDLHCRLGGDHERVVGAYAAAERLGEVPRTSNVRDMDPEEYARRLYRDGVNRGWLPR